MMMLTLTQLPIDLLTDILSRLPAKTICCLKIVCKSLFNLISDDEFLNYHLERSLATKTNLHYVFSTPWFDLQTYNLGLPSKNKHVLYSTDFDSFSNKIELSHPFKNCKTRVGIIGSCRGLLLLRVNDGHLLLYNPTTQTYNALPFLPVSSKPNHSYVFGFGYNNVFRDWKCVRIMQVLSKKTGVFQSEVMVYSLNANCWKRVVDVPCYFKPGYWGNGALVHEVIHWVGTNINNAFEFIVTFSLRDETFSCLQLPSFPVMSDDYLYVGNLDDCLCVLANTFVECSVWIMKEYGVAESWTMMFSFENYSWETRLVRPVSFSMDQKKLSVLTYLRKLAFIDLQTKVLSDLIFPNWDSAYDAYVYVENLLVLERNMKNETTKRGIGEAIITWFHNFTCPSMASVFDRILNFG